jgi:hypothetical protein
MYDYAAYISDAQTMLLYEYAQNDNDIHSYYQGKYIQSMFSENKTAKSEVAKFEDAVASYAIKSIEADACAALQIAADGIPVCKIVNFIASISGDFWDIAQNTPSS